MRAASQNKLGKLGETDELAFINPYVRLGVSYGYA